MHAMRCTRRSGLSAMLGGLLWIPYGVFEMLMSWGVDTVYRDDQGYEVVTDTRLYVLYLMLTALGLLGVFELLDLPTGRTRRIGRILTFIALSLAVISAGGVVIQ